MEECFVRNVQIALPLRALAGIALVACLGGLWGRIGAATSDRAPCRYENAEVFVSHFDRIHAVSWGVEDVRRGYAIRMSVRDPVLVSELLASLRTRSSAMPCGEMPCGAGDLRFIAEFKGEGKCSELFVADATRLADVNSGTRGMIDAAFWLRFTQWVKSEPRPRVVPGRH
jgi:uncharacterized low-complexity protein